MALQPPARITFLRDVTPSLRPEWIYALNKGLDFNKVASNSSLSAWWQCTKNPKHRWATRIRNRAVNKYGCPYCSHLRVLREDSFAARYPKIAAEWHPTKNRELDPFALAHQSNKRVWWQCRTPHKHEWQATIHTRVIHGSGCRECNRIRNPLASAFPEIAAEWHPTKNPGLDPSAIAASSRVRIWWQCRNNPKHEWQTSVEVRTRARSGCPECRRLTSRAYPTIDRSNPELLAEWHPTKNRGLSPVTVRANSNRPIWWICSRDRTHEWQTAVRNRAILGRGCRYCARGSKYVAKGKSLADRFPEIAKEWHPTLNSPLTPAELLPGSSRRVWWQCTTNPTHQWDATVVVRTNKKSRGICPFCSGHRVTTKNSLQSCHPEIAAQWHPNKNASLTPDRVKRASSLRYWWLCPHNPTHEWQSSVKNRTLHQSGCPFCAVELRALRLQQTLVTSAQSNTAPIETFKAGIAVLRSMAKEHVPKPLKLKQAFYRMVYSSAITVLETYLSDAFYQTVINEPTLIDRLMRTTPEFSERKYSLAEVVEWQNAQKQKVTEYLFDLVWHNLGRVRAMYRSVLGVEFPEHSEAVHKAVGIRHDIVHRGGKAKTGNVHRFHDIQIRDLLTAVESFVLDLNRQLTLRVHPANGSLDYPKQGITNNLASRAS
jgi:hypothetical protein